MKKNNIKAIALALGISASPLLFTGCANEYEATTIFSSILDDIKDNTCLDEILAEEENKELVTQMFILEKYLGISEKLHNLKLDNYEYETREPLNVDDRVEMLNVWEKYIEELEHLSPKDEKYESIAKELKGAEAEVNQWLYNNGYKTTINMASLVSKAKLVDCFSLDKSEYKNFNILENPENFSSFSDDIRIKYTEPNSKSEYYYSVPNTAGSDDYNDNGLFSTCTETKLGQMIWVIAKSKESDADMSQNDSVNYNENLNKNLIYYTGIIKSGMYASFTVGNDEIKQDTNNGEVNKVYENKISFYIKQQED